MAIIAETGTYEVGIHQNENEQYIISSVCILLTHEKHSDVNMHK